MGAGKLWLDERLVSAGDAAVVAEDVPDADPHYRYEAFYYDVLFAGRVRLSQVMERGIYNCEGFVSFPPPPTT